MKPPIRIALEADFPRMLPVINSAFEVETFIEGTRTDLAQMAEMLQKGEYLVAEDDAGQVAATVFVELRGDRGYFGMLAVDPSRQGSGLGRLMVEAAESYCLRHGCSHIDISVLSLRPELPPFYTKLGYVETAREPFHGQHLVKDGQECISIIMSKVLR